MKKVVATAVLGLLVASLVGVGHYTLNRKVFSRSLPAAVGEFFGKNDQSTIRIGAALGLSGLCASWGEDELRSAQLAVEEANKHGGINGKQIDLVVEDMQCDPRGSVNAMKKLIEADDVAGIIGPTWGESFQAGLSISNPQKIVAITPSGGIDAIIRSKTPITYVFSTYYPYILEASIISDYARNIGQKRMFIVHDNDPFGETFAVSFKESAEARGVSIAGEEKVPIGHDDFRTMIAKMKSLNLDGVFVAFQAPAEQAKFLKQAHELGLTIKIFNPSDIEDQALLKEYGKQMDGVVYAYPEASGNYAEFKKSFIKMFNREPEGPSVTHAYDAARVMIAGLTEHYQNGTDLKIAIEKTDIPGVSVKQITFDKDHKITDFVYQIKTVRDGKFVVVQ